MTILDEIVAHKKAELVRKRGQSPQPGLGGLPPTRDFKSALQTQGISLIAEVKRRSPSKGEMRENIEIAPLARDYEKNGAAAISVLTDAKFFGGQDADVQVAKSAVTVPILRKEFIIDAYQIYESRMLGADAILLIASILERTQLSSFMSLAEELGLSCLVEVHTAEEIEDVLWTGAGIIGINNRNLNTLQIDGNTSFRLRKMIPAGIITVSESGIRTRRDMLRLANAGFDAVLIGESLMSSPDVAGKLREFLGT